jgi:hypothetical protein
VAETGTGRTLTRAGSEKQLRFGQGANSHSQGANSHWQLQTPLDNVLLLGCMLVLVVMTDRGRRAPRLALAADEGPVPQSLHHV